MKFAGIKILVFFVFLGFCSVARGENPRPPSPVRQVIPNEQPVFWLEPIEPLTDESDDSGSEADDEFYSDSSDSGSDVSSVGHSLPGSPPGSPGNYGAPGSPGINAADIIDQHEGGIDPSIIYVRSVPFERCARRLAERVIMKDRVYATNGGRLPPTHAITLSYVFCSYLSIQN